LERKQQILTDEFDGAVAEKIMCQNQADETASRIDLANRLVNGLASENVRWKESVSMCVVIKIDVFFVLFEKIIYLYIFYILGYKKVYKLYLGIHSWFQLLCRTSDTLRKFIDKN